MSSTKQLAGSRFTMSGEDTRLRTIGQMRFVTVAGGGLIILVCAAFQADAQDVIQSVDFQNNLLAPLGAAGDMDGDGAGDLLASIVDTADPALPRDVLAYSGRTGQVLFTYPSFGAWPEQPSIDGIGDVDGDGRADFAIGCIANLSTGYVGIVSVYSGKTGNLLYSVNGDSHLLHIGSLVSRFGDVNGDGIGDIVAGYGFPDYWIPGPGSFVILSGADGSELTSGIPGEGWHPRFAEGGDLDADGKPDAWVGAPEYGSGTGRVVAYSTKAGHAAIWNIIGEGGNFGESLANAGDIDGDGILDVVVGAPNLNFAAGRVYVYSGGTGQLITSIDGEAPGDAFGSSVARGIDVNGDHVPDLICTAPSHGQGAGRVYVYSGATMLLHSTMDGGTGDAFGYSVASSADIDGDRHGDVFIDAISYGAGAGRISACSLARCPRVFALSRDRQRYSDAAPLTVHGEYFLAADAPTVTVAGIAAANVSIQDDATLICDVLPGPPGPAGVAVSNSLGTSAVDGAFSFTPAVLWDGSATLGGSVSVHVLCDKQDGMLIIAGTDPVSVPTPPYEGTLGIAPFFVFLVLPPGSWPFDHFDLSGTVPNDLALVGATILVQSLDGPRFTSPKDATWTNVASITIE